MVRFALSAFVLMAACAAPTSEELPVKEPEKSMPLAGSEWSLDTEDTNAESVFIQFGGDGKLSGSAGCNRMNGTYEQTGTAFKVGPVATTRMLCPPPIMEIERRVLSALGDARTVEATNLALRLIDENGETLLDLKRNDWD